MIPMLDDTTLTFLEKLVGKCVSIQNVIDAKAYMRDVLAFEQKRHQISQSEVLYSDVSMIGMRIRMIEMMLTNMNNSNESEWRDNLHTLVYQCSYMQSICRVLS